MKIASKKGYSLIEVLVALSILTGVALPLALKLKNHFNSRNVVEKVEINSIAQTELIKFIHSEAQYKNSVKTKVGLKSETQTSVRILNDFNLIETCYIVMVLKKKAIVKKNIECKYE